MEYQNGQEIKFSVHSTDFSKAKVTSADVTAVVEHEEGKVAENGAEAKEAVSTKYRYNIIGS